MKALMPEVQHAPLAAITGDENVLVLATDPGDESVLCGGLIAQCCRRGRPPFVMILGDGSSGANEAGVSAAETAAVLERETREAVLQLGLPDERLLMVGVVDDADVLRDTLFEAIVRAVILVMWARDCNVICAPVAADGTRAAGTSAIADEVARRSGVGRIGFGGVPPAGAWRLDFGVALGLKRRAVASYRLRGAREVGEAEVFWPVSVGTAACL